MMQRQVVASLRALDVCLLMCEEEADICLSRDARLYSHLIYGIISNDSDCAIMRGVRWIPASSLTLQWQAAERSQSAVYVDVAMRRHFKATRERTWGKLEPSAAAVSTSEFATSLAQPLVLAAARCQVWNNAGVMGALSLTDHSQLVSVALLAGNDFTREYAHLWSDLMPRTKNRVDQCAHFVSQPGQHGMRAEQLPAVKAVLMQNKVLRLGFKQSRIIYEGEAADDLDTTDSVSSAPIEAPRPAAAPAWSAPVKSTAAPAVPAAPAGPHSKPASSAVAARPRAKVQHVVPNAAHGFLVGRFSHGGDGLFFHQKSVVDGQLLSIGDEVEYEERDNEYNPGKKQAWRIVVVNFKNPHTKGILWPGHRPSAATASGPAVLPVSASGRPRATVSKCVPDAGYGFLRSRIPGQFIFYHQVHVVDWQLLSVGDEVEYDEGVNERDPSKAQALRMTVVRFNDEATRGKQWVSRNPQQRPPTPPGDAEEGENSAESKEQPQPQLQPQPSSVPQSVLTSVSASASANAVDSLTAALDAVNMNDDDLANLRFLIASGQVPSDTLSCIVRDYDNTAVYMEQVQPGEHAPHTPVFASAHVPAVASLLFSGVLLPPVESVTRPLRAAFALLCGKRQQRLFTVVGRAYKQLDAPLEHDYMLSHYLHGSRTSSDIPLFSVPEWPIMHRLQLFLRPFGCAMEGGEDWMASQIFQSSLPVSLRFPVLACRFLSHALVERGCSLAYLHALVDPLIAMALVLYAVESASNGLPRPPGSVQSAATRVLFVHDTAQASFPLMLAAGLASVYQSVCSNLVNLSQLLRLPAEILEHLPPHRLLHGPLLLSLLQNALPAQQDQTSPLPPPCVSLDLLRYRVRRADISASNTLSSDLMQAVTETFTEQYQQCRAFVYIAQRRAVEESKQEPWHAAPQPHYSASAAAIAQSAVASVLSDDDEVKQPSAALVKNAWTAVPPRRQQQPRAPGSAAAASESRAWRQVGGQHISPTLAAQSPAASPFAAAARPWEH